MREMIEENYRECKKEKWNTKKKWEEKWENDEKIGKKR